MSEQPFDQPTPFADVNRPPVGGAHQVTLLQGSSFCLSDDRGNCQSGHAEGLFVRDTRILSDWALLVDGMPVEPLTVIRKNPSRAIFIARTQPQPGAADSTLVVQRRRAVCEGMAEDVCVRNNAASSASIEIALHAGADLADIFEVKDGRVRNRATSRDTGDASIRIMHGLHGVLISSSRPGQSTRDGLRWRVSVPARGEWSVSLRVAAIIDGMPIAAQRQYDDIASRDLPALPEDGPIIETPDRGLVATLRRTTEDLRTLRIVDPQTPDRAVVAAGAPWYMALFGRDSLLTSWMAIPMNPELAIGTLQTLADYQGRREDAPSEEEPGRIPHEVRFGPAAPLAFGERHAYYGTVDATPLFVALFGELRRWGHDGPQLRSLLPAVDRAMEWIERYGDADGDGFVEYQSTSDGGLLNQGWKDSRDGINHADGTLAEAPIALAEVQGYTYAAFLARAELAHDLGDAPTEAHYRDKAIKLRAAFNRDFWLPAQGYFAVGLGRDKRPIDALASNAAHCLWSGIVDEDKAAKLADRLLSEELFSGWGVRTLASSMGAYNPVSYHNGSVWPHDTAICVAGLMRYGHIEAAQLIGCGLLEAAAHFDYRLPELFCGFARTEFAEPVPYPTSCSPQAWSAAAPLLVLRALLRLEPDLTNGRLECAPALPPQYLPFTLHGLRLGEWTVTLHVDRGGVHVDGGADDLTVLAAPNSAIG